MIRLGRADLDERFEVIQTIGRGSFGTVHEVRDRRTGAPFALKLLTGQVELGRTQRELEVSLQIDHPHVVRCHAGALTEDGGYLLLDLCDGSLADVLVDRARRHEAWELLCQTAEGLAALHERELVHRDLKPSNVLLRGDQAKVADLGLVRGGDLGTMTEEGMVLGTPAFMAPEQARGERVGPSCDVFALGVMLYELVEGHLPYPDEPPMARLGRVARADLFPWKRARGELPGPALDLVQAMLAPDPERRPTNLARVARVLRSHPPGSLDRPGETSVAALRLTQSSPRGRRPASTAPRGLRKPRSQPRRSRTPMVIGLLVLATVLGVLWPEKPAATPAPSLDAGPFPPDYLTRLERELEWASHQIVRVDGTLRPAAEGAPEDGEKDLLTWDPHGWFPAIERLPEVQRFHVWLGEGGRVEALSPELRAGLRVIDQAYAKRRFRRVFAPHLYLEPKPGEGPVPGISPWPEQWKPLAETTDPWRRAATGHLLRYLALHREIEQDLFAIGRGESADAPDSIVRIFNAPLGLVSDLLERRAMLPMMLPAWREHRNRPRLGAWIAPMTDHFESFFASATRALDSPGAMEWILWVVTGPLPVHDLGDFGAYIMAPPEAILGKAPDTPEGQLLLAHFLRRQVHGRELLGYPVDELRKQRARILVELLEPIDFQTADSYSLHLVRMALHEFQILRDGQAVRRVFMAHFPRLVPHAPRIAHWIIAFLGTMKRLDDPVPFGRDELLDLRHGLAESFSQATTPSPDEDLILEGFDQLIARTRDDEPLEMSDP